MITNKTYGYVFLFLALLLFPLNSIFAQTISCEISELLVMGGPDEYLFFAPQELHCDSTGNIYVRDISSRMGGFSSNILKYDTDGNFIRTIGRRGQGPGEFLRIAAFCLVQNRHLVIHDLHLKKWSLYSLDGEHIRDIRQGGEHNFYVTGMQSVNGTVVVNHTSGSRRDALYPLFTVFDSEMESVLEQFGKKDVFWDLSQDLHEHTSTCHGFYFAMLDQNSLAGGCSFYDGEVVFMTKQDENWQEQKGMGMKPKYSAYRSFPENYVTYEDGKAKFKDNRYKDGHMVLSSGAKRFRYTKWNSNHGIFTFNGSEYIQFVSYRLKKNKYALGINFFSRQGEYLGHYRKSDKYDEEYSHFRVLGKGRGDEFFFLLAVDDCPVIRKVRIRKSS